MKNYDLDEGKNTYEVTVTRTGSVTTRADSPEEAFEKVNSLSAKEVDEVKRNLIYTAITRAKKKVILIGQKQALMMAIHKTDSEKRNSLLGERIKSMVEKIEKGAS